MSKSSKIIASEVKLRTPTRVVAIASIVLYAAFAGADRASAQMAVDPAGIRMGTTTGSVMPRVKLPLPPLKGNVGETSSSGGGAVGGGAAEGASANGDNADAPASYTNNTACGRYPYPPCKKVSPQ
jgi:hypothetical protein